MCTIQNTCHLWKVHFSSVLIWYFYIHCILDLFASDAQGSICEICLTNLVSFLGFLDSLWIYLFRIPYGSTCSIYGHIDLFALCDIEISILRGRDTTLNFTVEPSPTPEGLSQCRVLAGGVLCLRWQQQATSAMSDEGPIPFMEVWDSSFFYALSYCFLLFGICCQFSSSFGLWIGGILAVTFGNCVLGLYKFSLKFILILHSGTTVLCGTVWGALSLFMVFSWLNETLGPPTWTWGLFLGLFVRHGSYFMRPSSINLLKKGWFYLLNYPLLCKFI